MVTAGDYLFNTYGIEWNRKWTYYLTFNKGNMYIVLSKKLLFKEEEISSLGYHHEKIPENRRVSTDSSANNVIIFCPSIEFYKSITNNN